MSGVAREIKSYAELIEVCNMRVNELGLTRAELDELAGLTLNYSSKILRRKHIKKFGPVSHPSIFGALGIRLFLLEDSVLTAKTLARRTPRKENFDNSAARERNAAARAEASGASPGLPAAAKHV
jgi:hypothetical protein